MKVYRATYSSAFYPCSPKFGEGPAAIMPGEIFLADPGIVWLRITSIGVIEIVDREAVICAWKALRTFRVGRIGWVLVGFDHDDGRLDWNSSDWMVEL